MIPRLLTQRRFAPFFWTQALGAFNDNVFKNVLLLLLTFVAVPRYGWDTGLLNNLAAALFILPFLLFSAWGGLLADRLDKRRLVRHLKVLELVTMSMAAAAVWYEAYAVLLALLFMMGTQSALFGPVKYAILPQHLSPTELVKGNAWISLGTFLSILLGTLLAGLLASLDGVWSRGSIAATLVALALLGLVASLWVPSAPPSQAGTTQWRPWRGGREVMRDAWRQPRVFRALLGISLFWFLGACYLTQLPAWTRDVVHGDEAVVSALLGAFALGVGAGALLCARLSAGRLEVGLIPAGAMLFGLAGLDLGLSQPLTGSQSGLAALSLSPGFWRQALDFAVIGLGGGLYIVPLYTLIQLESGDDNRARMIAANNILNALFMVLAAVFGIVVLSALDASLNTFMLALSVVSLTLAAVILCLVPRPVLRLSIFVLIRVLYRLRFRGRQSVPARGAALVVCNHVSFMDALILGGGCPRPLRFLMDRPIYESRWLNWFFRIAGAIPVDSERCDPGGVRRALDEVSHALRQGEVVMLFPEGRLTPDGGVHRFRRGVDIILARDPVPVVPAGLAGLWGSWTSNRGGKALTKWPRRFRARVALHFGDPIPVGEAKRADMERRVVELKRKAEAEIGVTED
ncbi:MFS transporter [Chromohalobacter sp. HP20-39]|uniref:MFS transporter n=1 Tax=Chromohalobacter sp. HP20-39 TaxID=3079306 RepID=UPI00294B4B1A|nr:MFS transporter [Chromohalobacter sp. HP20-39]MDV6318074.1 MFS transporter [Chromohalobacter sp. HP20-39]